MRTFDTHKHIKELTNSGLKEAQAEAIVQSLVDSREYDFSKLATKEQLKAVEERLMNKVDSIQTELTKFATKEQLATLEEKLTGRINAIEGNILKWIIPLFFTTWVMIAGLIMKLLSH